MRPTGKSIQEAAKVGPKVGASYIQIDGSIVVVPWKNEIQSNKCARSWCTIIVPNVWVIRISTKRRAASWDEIEFGCGREVPRGCENRTSTLT